MKKEFTKREKILLLVLAVLVIGLGYYKFVLQPINSKISDYRNMESELQLEYEQNQIKAARINMMEKEIQKAQADGIKRTVAPYDNSVNLMPELYGIMKNSIDYSLDFGELVFENDIVKRPVQITYDTSTYKQARVIIDKLYSSQYAMQVDDLTIQTREATDRQVVTTYISIIYFEANR